MPATPPDRSSLESERRVSRSTRNMSRMNSMEKTGDEEPARGSLSSKSPRRAEKSSNRTTESGELAKRVSGSGSGSKRSSSDANRGSSKQPSSRTSRRSKSADKNQEENRPVEERPSELKRVPGSSRTIRRMNTMENSDHVEAQPTPQDDRRRTSSRTRRHKDSVDSQMEKEDLGQEPAKQSQRGSKSRDNKTESFEEPGRKSSRDSKSSHGRRSSVDHQNSNDEPTSTNRTSGRSKSTQGRRASIENKNGSEGGSPSLHRAVRASKSTHQRSFDKGTPKSSKSAHRRSIDHRSSYEEERPSAERKSSRSKSSHRRSTEKQRELSPAGQKSSKAKSSHRRSISMDKIGPVGLRSQMRRSISMVKPEEDPRARSTHRRTGTRRSEAVATSTEQVSQRTRRTSISDAKQSLLDMHFKGGTRPRSKSPSDRHKLNFQGKLVRRNSCDSRISDVDEFHPPSKAQLLAPLPPIGRKSFAARRNGGSMDRRQTLAFLKAQELTKPDLDESHKRRLTDIGNRFKKSAQGISALTAINSGVKEKLSHLPANLGNGKYDAALSIPLHNATTSHAAHSIQPNATALGQGRYGLASSIPLHASTPTSAAQIALQTRKKATVTTEGIGNLLSLSELPSISKAVTSTRDPLRRSMSGLGYDCSADFASSFGTLSTASLSLSAHSKTSLSLSAHSKTSGNSSKTSLLSGNSSKASMSTASSWHSGKTASSDGSGAGRKSKDPVDRARVERLKRLSDTHRKRETDFSDSRTEHVEPFTVPSDW